MQAIPVINECSEIKNSCWIFTITGTSFSYGQGLVVIKKLLGMLRTVFNVAAIGNNEIIERTCP